MFHESFADFPGLTGVETPVVKLEDVNVELAGFGVGSIPSWRVFPPILFARALLRLGLRRGLWLLSAIQARRILGFLAPVTARAIVNFSTLIRLIMFSAVCEESLYYRWAIPDLASF
jgi:hypothetical protein